MRFVCTLFVFDCDTELGNKQKIKTKSCCLTRNQLRMEILSHAQGKISVSLTGISLRQEMKKK